MTVGFLIVLAVVVVGFLALLDRRDARDREERQTLLQRIQAPHAAVYEHHAAAAPPEPVASPLPMSDEEMAEMMGQRVAEGESVAAIIARMEAVENGYLQPEDGLLR